MYTDYVLLHACIYADWTCVTEGRRGTSGRVSDVRRPWRANESSVRDGLTLFETDAGPLGGFPMRAGLGVPM